VEPLDEVFFCQRHFDEIEAGRIARLHCDVSDCISRAVHELPTWENGEPTRIYYFCQKHWPHFAELEKPMTEAFDRYAHLVASGVHERMAERIVTRR
jgi:hypothetical protein